MKKFLALILALVMVFSLTGIAFAADVNVTNPVNKNTDANADDSSSVTVVVNPTDAAGILYHVLISWESLEFTYTAASSSWDVTSHTYKFEGGNWNDNEAVITIENHSNAGIECSAAYTAGANPDAGVTVTVTDPISIASADDDSYRGEDAAASSLNDTYKAGPCGTFTVTVGGAPTETTNGNVTMGTVVITISPASSAD